MRGKLLGFRSNKTWKKVVAIVLYVVYIITFLIVMLSPPLVEGTALDLIAGKASNLVLFLFIASPVIFLSEFPYRNRIPLFKYRSVPFNILGFMCCFVITLVLVPVFDNLHTETYKANYEIYEEEQAELRKIEAEKRAAEEAEAKRIASEKAESERVASEKAEAERVASEKAESERIASEKQQQESEAVESKKPLIVDNSSSILGSTSSLDADNSQNFIKDVKSINEPIETIDTAMISLLTEKGYSIEQASSIQEILNAIGVESIVIENMTGNAQKGLNAVICYPNGYTDRDRRFNFTTENGELFYAGFLNEDLYDKDKGGYLKKYNDVHVPEKKISIETYDVLRALAENAVKEYLKNPDSTNFKAFEWGIGRHDDRYQIIGSVVAKNGLGNKRDIKFSVWFIEKNDEFEIEGITLDGMRVK